MSLQEFTWVNVRSAEIVIQISLRLHSKAGNKFIQRKHSYSLFSSGWQTGRNSAQCYNVANCQLYAHMKSIALFRNHNYFMRIINDVCAIMFTWIVTDYEDYMYTLFWCVVSQQRSVIAYELNQTGEYLLCEFWMRISEHI